MLRIKVAEWGAAEYCRLVASLARGSQDQGPELNALTIRLERLYENRPLLFTNRGRYALEMALRVFADRRPGRPEVIIPAYICPSVIEAVERAGLTPVAADIGEDLNIDPAEVKAHFSSRTLAVVVAHMYGCPAAIEEIEPLCRREGVFLVDDSAQLAGVPIGDKPAGCFGDCGLLSFSMTKTLVAGSINAGGALIVNDPSLEAPLKRQWNALPEASYSLADFLSFLADGPFYADVSRITYYAERIRRQLGIERPHHTRECPPRRIANANAVVLLSQLDGMASRIAGRIRTMTGFRDELARYEAARLPQFAPDGYRTRVMAVLPRGLDASRIRRALHGRGVQTRLGYPVPPRLAGNLRRASDASARLLELPSHSRMKRAEIARVAGLLGTCLDNVPRQPQPGLDVTIDIDDEFKCDDRI